MYCILKLYVALEFMMQVRVAFRCNVSKAEKRTIFENNGIMFDIDEEYDFVI